MVVAGTVYEPSAARQVYALGDATIREEDYVQGAVAQLQERVYAEAEERRPIRQRCWRPSSVWKTSWASRATMEIHKWHVCIADLKPRTGTEPGKVRPVVVVQTDLLRARWRDPPNGAPGRRFSRPGGEIAGQPC